MKRYHRYATATVAITLLVLSLRHLAAGVQSVTGVSELEAWLMAIGIDLAMVALELATIAGIRTGWTRGLIIATCILSAGFNVMGFIQHAVGALGQALAVALGVFVPAAVYGLTDTVNRSRTVPGRKPKARRSKATVRKLRAVQ